MDKQRDTCAGTMKQARHDQTVGNLEMHDRPSRTPFVSIVKTEMYVSISSKRPTDRSVHSEAPPVPSIHSYTRTQRPDPHVHPMYIHTPQGITKKRNYLCE